ncbi:MAG: sensor histidine kinase [Actinomycetales bacterium]|nr:sensor histidine kinase [Actinomycetales bacterium]
MIDTSIFAFFGISPLVALAMCAPLAARRTYPVLSVMGVYLVGLFVVIQGYQAIGFFSTSVLVALYSVTAYGPRWASRTALGTGILGCFLLSWSVDISEPFTAFDPRGSAVVLLMTVPLVLVAWAGGKLRASRVESLRAREDRFTRLAVEREQELKLAAQAERARIAREMHDIVAHSLTVMVAQADGGRYAGAAEPAAATHALETIAETGRAALADMRRLLGVLRDDDADSDGEHRALAPQPASGDLYALVEQVRASGLRVSLVRMGTPRTLPPGVGLTAHRICQEALTNVMKHAGPDPTVTVLVQWTDTSLTLEVSDDGRGASADTDDGGGHGLLGMRERAMMLGGTLTVGPRPGGGFRVRAQLPLPAPGGTS